LGASLQQRAAETKIHSAEPGLKEVNVKPILATCLSNARLPATRAVEALEQALEEALEEARAQGNAVLALPNKGILMELEVHALTLLGMGWWWAAREVDAISSQQGEVASYSLSLTVHTLSSARP